MSKLNLSEAAAELLRHSVQSAGGDKEFGSSGYKPKVSTPNQSVRNIGTAGHKTTDQNYSSTDGVPTATPPGQKPPVGAESMKRLKDQPQSSMGRKDLVGGFEGDRTSDSDIMNRVKGKKPKQTMDSNPGSTGVHSCCEEETLEDIEHDIESMSDKAFMQKYQMPKQEMIKKIQQAQRMQQKGGKAMKEAEETLEDVEHDIESMSDRAFMQKYQMPKQEMIKKIQQAQRMQQKGGKAMKEAEETLEDIEHDIESMSDKAFMQKYQMPKQEMIKKIQQAERMQKKAQGRKAVSEEYEEASIEEVENDMVYLSREDFEYKYDMSIYEAKVIISKEKQKQREESSCKARMKEDIDAILSGENLSEEFKDRAAIIFEAAVETRVEEIAARLEEKYDEELQESIVNIKEEYADKLDAYLDYVVENWFDENRLAVERGLRTEIAEDFISSLKNLFVEHYIDIPDEKVNVVEELASKVEELEEQVNIQILKNIDLKKSISEQRKIEAIHSVCEGLTLSQAEKIKSIAKNVEYVSEEDYSDKLNFIKESYFDTAPVRSYSAQYLLESDEYQYEENDEYVDPSIRKYVSHIAKQSKNHI